MASIHFIPRVATDGETKEESGAAFTSSPCLSYQLTGASNVILRAPLAGPSQTIPCNTQSDVHCPTLPRVRTGRRNIPNPFHKLGISECTERVTSSCTLAPNDRGDTQARIFVLCPSTYEAGCFSCRGAK